MRLTIGIEIGDRLSFCCRKHYSSSSSRRSSFSGRSAPAAAALPQPQRVRVSPEPRAGLCRRDPPAPVAASTVPLPHLHVVAPLRPGPTTLHHRSASCATTAGLAVPTSATTTGPAWHPQPSLYSRQWRIGKGQPQTRNPKSRRKTPLAVAGVESDEREGEKTTGLPSGWRR